MGKNKLFVTVKTLGKFLWKILLWRGIVTGKDSYSELGVNVHSPEFDFVVWLKFMILWSYHWLVWLTPADQLFYFLIHVLNIQQSYQILILLIFFTLEFLKNL